MSEKLKIVDVFSVSGYKTVQGPIVPGINPRFVRRVIDMKKEKNLKTVISMILSISCPTGFGLGLLASTACLSLQARKRLARRFLAVRRKLC